MCPSNLIKPKAVWTIKGAEEYSYYGAIEGEVVNGYLDSRLFLKDGITMYLTDQVLGSVLKKPRHKHILKIAMPRMAMLHHALDQRE